MAYPKLDTQLSDDMCNIVFGGVRDTAMWWHESVPVRQFLGDVQHFFGGLGIPLC